MKIKLLLVVVLFVSLNVLNAQRDFYVGAGIIYQSFDHNTFIDDGKLIKSSNSYDWYIQSPEFQFNLGAEVYDHLFLEFNFKLKQYFIGYENDLSSINIGSYHGILKTFQMPIKLKYRINIGNNFELYPIIGIVYCHDVNPSPDFLWNENEPEFNTTELIRSKRYDNFFLGLIAFDIEYRFLKRHSIAFGFDFFKGNKELFSHSIDYRETGDPKNYSAKIFGKGDYFSFGLSYRFHLMRNE